jgi:hypothetical protein
MIDLKKFDDRKFCKGGSWFSNKKATRSTYRLILMAMLLDSVNGLRVVANQKLEIKK